MMDWKKELPRLSAVEKDKQQFCLAVVTKAEFEGGKNEAKILRIFLEDYPYVAVNPKQRKLINSIPRPNLLRTLKFIENSKNVAHFHDPTIASEKEPLLAAAAGVLPILSLEEKKYPLVFLREINPISFTTASGLTDTFEEILNPTLVIFREFFEELLITSRDQKRVYEFSNKNLMSLQYELYWRAHAKLWNLHFESRIPTFISQYPLEHKECIEIYWHNSCVKKLSDIVISISPTMGEINSLMAIRIHVDSTTLDDFAVFDCELHFKYPDIPLNRTVAALDLDVLNPHKKPPIVTTWSCGLQPRELFLSTTVSDVIRAIRP